MTKLDELAPKHRIGFVNPAGPGDYAAYVFYRLVPGSVMMLHAALGLQEYTKDGVETAIANFMGCADELARGGAEIIVQAGIPIAAQLGRLGTHVDTAGSPLEATRCLSAGEVYDAVLMDVRLPGTTGIDLHRALKARCPEMAARVVFMTGDLVNDDVIRAVKETGNPLLEKPFSFEELRAALCKVTAGADRADHRQPV